MLNTPIDMWASLGDDDLNLTEQGLLNISFDYHAQWPGGFMVWFGYAMRPLASQTSTAPEHLELTVKRPLHLTLM